VLSAGRIQVAATVDSLLDAHLALTGPADGVDDLHDQVEIVTAQRAGRQALVLARTDTAPPGWAARSVTMEELVLGYLLEPAARVVPEPGLEIAR
jgi:ABC-2 type transport system ATP-binding protein